MWKPPSVDSKNFRRVKESLAKVLLSDGRQPEVKPFSLQIYALTLQTCIAMCLYCYRDDLH